MLSCLESLTKCLLWKQEVAANGLAGLPRCLSRCVCPSLQGVVTRLIRLLKVRVMHLGRRDS